MPDIRIYQSRCKRSKHKRNRSWAQASDYRTRTTVKTTAEILGQNCLHGIPQGFVDDRLVQAGIGLVLMHNLTAVDAVLGMR